MCESNTPEKVRAKQECERKAVKPQCKHFKRNILVSICKINVGSKTENNSFRMLKHLGDNKRH